MAYTKTNWVNGQTPINATNLNHIEDGIESVEQEIPEVKNTQTSSTTKVYSCDYVNDKMIDSSGSKYIKFADGTCIVWGSYDTAITLSASSGDTIICNLPITMKDTNYTATISKKDGGNGFSYIADTVGTRGTTSFNISLWNNGGASSTVVGYYWQVIGKWK